MADPLVCVSLEGTTVKEMLDEAARAGIAGADLIEVRFDRLYLSKPQPTVTENEEGEVTKTMPPASEWPVRDFADINIEESITALKDGIALPVIFADVLSERAVTSLVMKRNASTPSRQVLHQERLGLTSKCLLRTPFEQNS